MIHPSVLLLLLPQAPVVPIAPQARGPVAGEMGQVYDVRDLLEASPLSFPLPAFSGTSDERNSGSERRLKCQALERLVRGFIEPPLVDGRDEVLAYPEAGILLARVPAQGHAWTQQFIELQRRPLRQIEVKLWALEAPLEHLRRLGLGDEGRLTLPPGGADRFLGDATRESTNLLSAPSLLLYERAIASLSTLDDYSYVKEFRLVTVQPGNQVIADPVVETLHEGWSMEVLGAQVSPKEFGIELFARQQVVQRPVATHEIELQKGVTGTVSTPVAMTHELKTRFALPLDVLPYDGETWQESKAPALVFRIGTGAKERDLAVMIQVRVRESKPAGPAARPASPVEER
jgi:hypothetical protein